MSEEQQGGVFLGHTSCPKCGSRDNQGVYEKTREDGSTFRDATCFGCKHYIRPNDIEEWLEINGFTSTSSGSRSQELSQEQRNFIESLRIAGWKDRGIVKSSYEKYGCKAEADEEGKPAWFYYPYYNKNKDVTGYKKKAYKKEEDSKGRLHRKTFSVGEVKKNKSLLFGQQLFDAGGKILIITEGEDDAIAWWQSLHKQSGGKYSTPCVSIGFGAGSAVEHIKANYDYVTSFEKVLVAFDSDDAGKDAAEKVLRILKPGQGYRVNFKEHKDASDYLGAGKQAKLVDLFWRAEKFSPVDVCSLGDLWGEFENSVEDDIIELPPQFATLSTLMGGGPAHGEVTVFGALTSVGKAIPTWEKVITPEGSKDAGDVLVGDSLIGSNGKPTTVTGVFHQGVRPIYKMTLNDGTELFCDENHLWSWRKKHGRINNRPFNVTTIHDMITVIESESENDKVYLPDNPCVKWEEKELPIDPWLVGFLIGDGSLSGSNLSFTCAEEDVFSKVVEKLESSGQQTGHFNGRYGWNIKQIERDGRTSKFRSMLTELGMDTKSVDKKIPDDYLYGSVEQRLELLRGLFDADGHVSKGKANMEFSTSSEALAKQTKFLVRSLGGTCRVVQRDSGYKNACGSFVECHKSYRLFIKQPLGLNYFSSKKHTEAFVQGRAYARNEVVSIEPCGSSKTVCFTVDADDSLFLMNDFVVTHNSTIINNIAYHAAVRQGKKVGLMYLESSGKEMVSSFLSIHSEQNLALKKREELNMTELKKEFKDLIQDDTKFVVVRHDGAFRNIEELTDKLRWMVKAAGCDMIVVDPLQASVPDNSNEMLDRFMDAMLKLTKESNCSTVIVSHMRKPDGKNAHDVDEYSLKGSSSINQIAFNTILLSRDKTHDNQHIRNSTKMTLVKCRRTGMTGDAGWLEYDHETTRIREIPDPYDMDELSFNSEDVFEDAEAFSQAPQHDFPTDVIDEDEPVF